MDGEVTEEFGSSPRERGAPGREGLDVSQRRLIPARAGSTGRRFRRLTRSPAHPRASGEHEGAVVSGRRRMGSSPRERGALTAEQNPAYSVGLIPARAGSTPRSTRPTRSTTAHPRASGEHDGDPNADLGDAGSSPRERGALRLDLSLGRLVRLIPARAGSTGARSTCAGCEEAHPRASGEHRGFECSVCAAVGSSPRERGARQIALNRGLERGLIPARAGSTQCGHVGEPDRPAHPRASGEHPGRARL